MKTDMPANMSSQHMLLDDFLLSVKEDSPRLIIEDVENSGEQAEAEVVVVEVGAT